ncbi:hypothetical protein ABIB35_002406 [Arthrobacter sp. UYP6]|uniref:hypothetical protein n=1 Tax=Arthrobacter sp. UYP6 TaxID=1756378 RepID=UPI00339296F7
MSMSVEVAPVNPADVYAANRAAAYVIRAAEELTAIEQVLPGLVRMEWRSEAAGRFEELCGQHIKSVSATAADLRDCAAAVEQHVQELRSLGHEVQ